MDFAIERKGLEETLAPLTNRGQVHRLLARLRALEAEHGIAATTPDRKHAIEEEVEQLLHDACDLAEVERERAQPPAPPPRTTVIAVLSLVGVTIIACLVLVFGYYAPQIGARQAGEQSSALLTATAILFAAGIGGAVLLQRLLAPSSGVSSATRYASRAQFWTRPMLRCPA